MKQALRLNFDSNLLFGFLFLSLFSFQRALESCVFFSFLSRLLRFFERSALYSFRFFCQPFTQLFFKVVRGQRTGSVPRKVNVRSSNYLSTTASLFFKISSNAFEIIFNYQRRMVGKASLGIYLSRPNLGR